MPVTQAEKDTSLKLAVTLVEGARVSALGSMSLFVMTAERHGEDIAIAHAGWIGDLDACAMIGLIASLTVGAAEAGTNKQVFLRNVCELAKVCGGQHINPPAGMVN